MGHGGQVALKKPAVLLAALGLGGGSGGVTAEYQAILDYATLQGFTLPSANNQATQNALLSSMKAAGIWDKLDIFYNFFTDGDANFSKINWKNPGGDPAFVLSGVITFAPFNGWTGDGTSGQIYTQLAFPTAKMTTASFGVFTDCVTTGVNHYMWGTAMAMYVDSGAGRFFSFQATDLHFAAPTSAFFTFNITGGVRDIYADGIEIATDNGGAVTFSTNPIFLLSANGGAFSTGPMRNWGCGASINGSEVAFNDMWTSYKATSVALKDYGAVLAYATLQGFVKPTTAQQADHVTLISDLYKAGAWQKLDVFYNFLTNGDSGFAKINWKTPGSFQAVGTGHEPLFAPNDGFRGDGIATYLDTTFSPSVNGVKYKLNDASMVIDVEGFSYTSGFPTALGGGSSSRTFFLSNAPLFYAAINDVGSTSVTSSFDVLGILIASRFGSLATNKALFIDGASITVASSDPSSALPPETMAILASATQSLFFPGIARVAALGGSLVGNEAGFTTAWKKYKDKWLAHPYDRILSYATFKGYTLPSVAQRDKQRTLIDTLISAGIWDKLDVFYNFYTNGSSDFAKINWKDPGNCQAIGTGHEPTFAANTGFKGDAVAQYLNSQFIALRSRKLTQTSGSIFIESTLTIPANNVLTYVSDGNLISIQPLFFAGSNSMLVMGGNITWSPDQPSHGFWLAYRESGNSEKGFRNGAQLGADSVTAGTIRPNIPIYILAGNTGSANYFSAQNVSVWGIGLSLAGLETTLFNAWIAYKSAAAYAEIIDFATLSGYTLPSAQQQEAGELLIYDMMNIGAWDRLDVFYNFFTDGDGSFATINWKNPSASTLLAPAGGITFNTNDGAVGDGVVGYITTGIIPGVNTESLSLNDAGVFMDTNGVTPGAKALFGALDPGIGSVALYPSIGGMSVSRAATDTDITWTAPSPADGFWLLERNAVDQVQAYLNYDLKVDSSLMASALPGVELYLFAANNAGAPQDYSDATIRCFGLGASLKQVESRLYQAWETYKARAV